MIDPDTGALVSVHGPLAATDAQWLSATPRVGDKPELQCAMVANFTWRTAAYGEHSNTGPFPTPANVPSECCATCRAHPSCGVATWSSADRMCYMANGLEFRLVSNNGCRDPSVELPPNADVMHGCWFTPPKDGGTVAIRPLRPMSNYVNAIKDLASIIGNSSMIIAGANMETIANLNDRLDAEYLEARILDQLRLKSDDREDSDWHKTTRMRC